MVRIDRRVLDGTYIEVPAWGGDGRAATILKGPCGCGKTTGVNEKARSENLLQVRITVNRRFNENSHAAWLELKDDDDDTFNYMDLLGASREKRKEAEAKVTRILSERKGTIFVSVESFHRLWELGLKNIERLDMFVIDETTEVAAKMLSKTSPKPHNFRLMRKVAA